MLRRQRRIAPITGVASASAVAPTSKNVTSTPRLEELGFIPHLIARIRPRRDMAEEYCTLARYGFGMTRWMAVLVVACVGSCDMGNPAPAVTASVTPGRPAILNASGSTFQKPFHAVAIDAFAKSHPNVVINYGGGGSGKGRIDLADMVVDFAGTDAPFKASDNAKLEGGDVLYFPIQLGAIAIAYHVDGLAATLQLSPATLARIFERDLRMWNDPAIANENPGVTLPAVPIVVVHRADGAATTATVTKLLDGTRSWRLANGSTVDWPSDTEAAIGNGGVGQVVAATNGAIGYLDLADAKAAKLAYARIENRAGNFVHPTADSASAAADGVWIADDLTFSVLGTTSPAAYPITYQSWVIVYAKQDDPAKAAALRDYLSYLLGDGQLQLLALDLAPLPTRLRDRAVAQLAKIHG